LIQSRSTYGRMGLIAATATYVTPGYKGCPTLEVVNEGEVPVRVKPGEQLCQLIALWADEDAEDLLPSRYQCATRPFASRDRG
jgi:dCTP deaminase